ncbi:heparan sulfate 2-O-sulfotransferase pipe isoform X5 [Eupeodes corollae]|nr:heparan sulfate 2-O-sulfotransferase pipe isoform X5 [Eupeodes corollae]
MHTKNLNTRLREMEVKLQPSEFSALGLTGEHHISGGGDGSRSGNDINTLHGTYQYLKSTGQNTLKETQIQNDDNNLNNTKRAQVDIILFNRVPKVGSQSLMVLMNKLGKINNYIARRDSGKSHETIILDKHAQKEFAINITTSITPPFAYSQHIAYVNFTKLQMPRPIYINLVRDPIERIISWHYYIRAPWYYEDLKRKLGDKAPSMPDETFMNMDFDTCVKTGDIHCQFPQEEKTNLAGDHRRQTLFFCGQNRKRCLPFNSKGALQRAKRTVEKEYAVVGTWEDTNITLAVLEAYIPKFFRHARTAYYLGHDILSKVNRNKFKKSASMEVKELLQKNFTREIEFYEFCKQRLYRQYAAISEQYGQDEDYILVPDDDN